MYAAAYRNASELLVSFANQKSSKRRQNFCEEQYFTYWHVLFDHSDERECNGRTMPRRHKELLIGVVLLVLVFNYASSICKSKCDSTAKRFPAQSAYNRWCNWLRKSATHRVSLSALRGWSLVLEAVKSEYSLFLCFCLLVKIDRNHPLHRIGAFLACFSDFLSQCQLWCP